jgi:hypothetical protein
MVISRHFGKTARCLLSPTADIGGAIPITEYYRVSHRQPSYPACSRRNCSWVAASAYWSLATMIAATMVVDAPED